MSNLYQKLSARLRGRRGRAAEREQIGAAAPALAPLQWNPALYSGTVRQLPPTWAACAYCGGRLPSAAAVKCQNCGAPVDEPPRLELVDRASLGTAAAGELPPLPPVVVLYAAGLAMMATMFRR